MSGAVATAGPREGAAAGARVVRVGVVVDEGPHPAWAAELLERLDGASHVERAVTVTQAPAASPGGRALKLLERVDAARHPAVRDPLARHPPPAGAQQSAAVLAGADLDVVLALGTRADEVPAEIARHGVWSLHFGDLETCDGAIPGYWEMHDGAPVAGSVLLARLAGEARPRVIYRSWSCPDPVSLRRTRAHLIWKAAAFPLRRLRDLAAGGWSPLEGEPLGGPAVARGNPSGPQVARHAAATAGRRARRALSSERWTVRYRPRDPGAARPSASGMRVLDAPPGHYYADPFPFERDGRAFLFVEDFSRAAGRGSIAAIELAEGGQPGPARTVLESPHHLSYPFVFEDSGEVFMIPESATDGGVALYRAAEFPLRWERERTLIAGVSAYDATLLRHAGRLWLFAALAEPGTSSWDELHLFSATSLSGAWEPHPLNPIVSDVRCARPAGRIFSEGGALIRPGQDSSGRYGRAIALARIDTLTRSRYAETPVGRIGPGWLAAARATHTWNRSRHWEAIDAIVAAPRFGRR